MALIVKEVESEQDFIKVAPMDHDAWLIPYNPQLKHFRPYLPDRDEAIAAMAERTSKRWRNRDSNTFFLKVVDPETPNQDIMGFAIWEVNEMKNPGHAEPTVAHWHPEGSDERKFAEIFINGLWGFLAKRVTRPHLDLLSITVHPACRHRGAGRLLINWGKAKADELGIEIAISSLPSARGAYEKCGIGAIEVIPPSPDLQVENPSERWKELLQEDLTGWLMWRPVGRDFEVGKDKAPWVKE
ncbi:hypothetical protein BDV96DRAFT_585508 [Lophiotrema nucula]|uniref:N-acetyltransferase domain-containing protein n=1 Tax=Lophiotrema nucula TaxID=690887 RepID=A0A6A5YQK4_9PLEO|nr:hypothetical protein BDV96DRAFT_585508 [Lophiotrema nucula]